ncbi:MAG: diphthine--ammonia ligase [Nanoarchaeota archaeon]|nr:diphthine--ammonia ligase [Nanoarchaeota archaeon]
MRLGILFSGGKDSAYAAYLAKKEDNDIICLINIISENKSSYMFHTPSVDKAVDQAQAMGINIIVCSTKGEKEKELRDLEDAIKKAIKRYGIEGLVTGALASNYQAERIQKICDKLKIKCINPLWKKDADKYWDDLLKEDFEIMIIGVASDGLGKEWLGRIVDKEALAKLKKMSKKYLFHIGFEGGEAETFVLDCPLFLRKLQVSEGKVHWNKKDKTGTYEIQKLKLMPK